MAIAATRLGATFLTNVVLAANGSAVQRDFGRHSLDRRLRALALDACRSLRLAGRSDGFELFAILVLVVKIIPAGMRVLDGHLRLRRSYDAVIVLGVLKVVLCHDPVARTQIGRVD